MRLAWVTDPHLNFLDDDEVAAFVAGVRSHRPDAVAVSGDIAEGPTVCHTLRVLAAGFGVPVHFVLGNHDFYRDSVRGVRAAVRSVVADTPGLTYLSAAGVVRLTDRTALVGHDGWGDGRFGNALTTPVELNDFYLIEELRGPNAPTFRPRAELLDILAALGDEAAAHFRAHLPAAVDEFAEVIAVTHVPPFAAAAWHGGNPSDPDWLPWFACKAVGDVLLDVMASRPTRRLTVLCGHTHGAGVYSPRPNLTVRTGGAEYGNPRVQEVFEV